MRVENFGEGLGLGTWIRDLNGIGLESRLRDQGKGPE